MSKLFLEMHKFKKLKSDAQTTTFQHADGHTITVAHAKLSPKMRAEMEALPLGKESKPAKVAKPAKPEGADMMAKGGPVKMADGGDVQDIPINLNAPIPEQLANPDPGARAVEQTLASTPTVTKIDPSQDLPTKDSAPFGTTPEKIAEMREAASGKAPDSMNPQPNAQSGVADTGAPPQGQAADPYGTEAYTNAYMRGLGEQKAGLAGEAQAEGAMGQSQARDLQQSQAVQQQMSNDYQTHFQTLNQERDALMHDIANQHIDPNHLMGSMDTWQKFATGIGLILGGIGAGLTGGENPVMSYLNKQIDRDIDAQKANLGKKETLLSANMRQFGNLKDATEMTRVMQMDMLSNQLKMEAAKAQSPLAKARALQEAGKIDQTAAPIVSQMAMRRTLLGGAASGQIPPEQVIRAVLPENEKPAALKELKEAQDAVALRDNTLGAFDQIAHINTMGNKLGSPLQTPRQVAAIQGAALDKLTKDTSGRVTPETVSLVKEILSPGATDTAQTQQIRRARLNDLLSQGMHYPTLKQWGIDPTRNARFAPQGQSRLGQFESPPVLPPAKK